MSQKIKVTRAFCIGGEPQKVGKVLDVAPALAAELIANHKAEKVVPAPKKPEPEKESQA